MKFITQSRGIWCKSLTKQVNGIDQNSTLISLAKPPSPIFTKIGLCDYIIDVNRSTCKILSAITSGVSSPQIRDIAVRLG